MNRPSPNKETIELLIGSLSTMQHIILNATHPQADLSPSRPTEREFLKILCTAQVQLISSQIGMWDMLSEMRELIESFPVHLPALPPLTEAEKIALKQMENWNHQPLSEAERKAVLEDVASQQGSILEIDKVLGDVPKEDSPNGN